MPINLVGLRAWFIPFGRGLVLLTANIPLVDIEFKSSELGSVFSQYHYPSGFVLSAAFGGW